MSNSSDSSKNQSLPRQPKPNECGKCRALITKTSDALTCFMCQRRIYVRCISNVSLTEVEVDKIRRGQSPLHFSCFLCDDRIIKNAQNSRLFETELIIQENNKKANAMIKQMKAELPDLNSQIIAQNKELQDTKRENQIIQEQRVPMLAEQKSKRRRINFTESSPNATLQGSRMETESDNDDQFRKLQSNVRLFKPPKRKWKSNWPPLLQI